MSTSRDNWYHTLPHKTLHPASPPRLLRLIARVTGWAVRLAGMSKSKAAIVNAARRSTTHTVIEDK